MSEIIPVIFPIDQQEGTQSVVAKWFKAPGDFVALHEPLIEISTDKVSMEVPSPAAGILIEVLKGESSEIAPGDVLGTISPGAAAGDVTTAAIAGVDREMRGETRGSPSSAPAETELTPAVKRLLKEHNLSPAQVKGTGRNGRITPEDVAQAAQSKGAREFGPSRDLAHTPMRKMVARHMVDSLLHTAPHVTSVFEVDFSAIIAHREKHKATFEAKGVKLTFTSYFLEACAKALKAVPEVNSRWHDDRLELFDDINIGVGTALGSGGLIVPVVRRVQDLDLFQIAERLQDLTSRARDNALKSEEVQGGTFTISNHGVSGSLVATPIIINQPQSAILGVGKLEKRTKVVDVGGADTIVIRPLAYVTLTIDHRVLDGFQANSFLTAFTKTLEEYR